MMKQSIEKLLNDLELVSEHHEEIFDTDVREELATAICCGFIAPQSDYRLPKFFAMFSDEGNSQIQDALSKFLMRAIPIAEHLGWTEQQRQDAFQDISVTSSGGLTYDEFFGHAGES